MADVTAELTVARCVCVWLSALSMVMALPSLYSWALSSWTVSLEGSRGHVAHRLEVSLAGLNPTSRPLPSHSPLLL